MGTLSTTALVSEVVQRCRIGIDANFAIARLNQSYRDIVRNVGFIWELKKTTLTVASAATTADLPPDFDPGKPAYLSGPSAMPINLPHKTFDTGFDYQLFYSASASAGLYSAWTFYANFAAGPPVVYTYTAQLFPASAAPGGGGFSLPFVYHQLYADQIIGTDKYFPSPSEFDYVLILMAEAETKRIYEIPSWTTAKGKADEALGPLIDIYRSSKLVLPGLMEQDRETKESNAKRAE